MPVLGGDPGWIRLPAAEALDRLAGLTASTVAGRLLLLHGPPGTGKTTAVRALARAWRPWCELHVVLDPENLFASPSYLMELALGDDDERAGRWRCLLLEDCDELVRAGAKDAADQALARLLNLTDGLLGQSLDIIVAITTNEPLHVLHPAVTRPGRCLADIEVTRLTRAEAAAWLGTSEGIGPEAPPSPSSTPSAAPSDPSTVEPNRPASASTSNQALEWPGEPTPDTLSVRYLAQLTCRSRAPRQCPASAPWGEAASGGGAVGSALDESWIAGAAVVGAPGEDELGGPVRLRWPRCGAFG